ncbi:MAG: tRNA (N6-isopentenyl adenosine(37)-C2)-methylthiotransferase MiaB [Rickettsiales bacterium]
MQKGLYIKTYGCQMNVYDSVRMGDLLKPFGYSVTSDIENANMVILNTCHIREKATEKVYSELGRIKKIKDRSPDEMLVIVAGCVGQAEGKEIFNRSPWVDIVVGPQSYQNLPELMAKLSRENKHVIDLNFVDEEKFDSLPESSKSQGASAFLSIQEGCDKFCKFCCVPYTRGAEFSRPLEKIYREALQIVSQGSKEITLLGQNVSAYHGKNLEGEEISLAKLIRSLDKIEGLERIRYTTSHPREIYDDLILAHKEVQKLMPFLHLPVQSGSNRILADMNRKHTANDYLKVIEKLRNARPEIAFSSDFIVGYPGESDKDFQDTMNLVKNVGYAQAYSFKYSPRPGTPASILPQLPEDVKNDRLQELQALLREQQTNFNNSFLNKTVNILIEKKGRKELQMVGKSEFLQAVTIDNINEGVGKIIPVKVNKIMSNSLLGEAI